MKPHLVDRSSLENSSFRVSHNCKSHFLKVWHYHPEIELVLILKSTGTRFIGDNIEKFEAGEIVLIGENLPHLWLNDKPYFETTNTLKAESIVLHFKNDCLGATFWNTMELKPVLQMLEKAKLGLKFSKPSLKLINQIKQLTEHKGFEKLVKFLKILNGLSIDTNAETLASTGYVKRFISTQAQGLKPVYEYMFKKFQTPISLNDAARLANMNASAFSRCFKRLNKKTFTAYLNEIRIGYACRLLLEEQYSIKQICYESGFQNISNFNRQFKKIMGLSPSDYMKSRAF